VFLPPYAELGATPYTTMTNGREASYANFRFYSETLLADVLPRQVEESYLAYHNDHVGIPSFANEVTGVLCETHRIHIEPVGCRRRQFGPMHVATLVAVSSSPFPMSANPAFESRPI